MATTGHDETVRLWETASGKQRFQFRIDGKRNFDRPRIAFAPDGKALAAANGSGPNALSVWDTTTGKERLKRDLPMQDGTTLLAFTDGGKKLVMFGYQDKFDVRTGKRSMEPRNRKWDIEKSTEVSSFQPLNGTMAFSPDGKILVALQEDGLHVCDSETGKKLRTLSKELGRWRRSAWSADGTFALEDQDMKAVQLWDTATGKLKGLVRGGANDFYLLALSADSKRLVSSSVDNTLRVWDVVSGDAIFTHRHDPMYSGIGCVAISPDGKTVAAGSINYVFSLMRWDIATGKEIPGPDGHITPVNLVGFTANGKVATGAGNPIRIWDPADGKQLSVLNESTSFRNAAIAPNGMTIAISRNDFTVCVRDLATGKEKFTLDGQAGYTSILTFAPDAKTLVVAYTKNTPKGNDYKLILWDVVAGKKMREISTPTFGTECLAFSPDGKRLIYIGLGLRIWDPATGNDLGGIPVQGIGMSGNNTARFSPDGVLLAAPCYPKGFGVWDTTTRKARGRFDSDGVTVRSVAFSNDNRLLACGKEDGSVEIWDLKRFTPVAKGQGPRGRVYALAFSKDDRSLVSGHEDTTALVWDVPKLLAAGTK
ncbi:MAG: WD40 repeat domain-containing protein [Planctomycetes bacterium]|nr:WD40 repeat domain-containing protein [Planctomycetota bacterium]